ncbi:MAG: putative holin [Mycobacterium sp.]
MIPLPRPWLLAGVMLIGSAVGMLTGLGATLLVSVRLRPDLVIGLVLGLPSAVGLLTILFSSRRWMTALGAFLLALAVGGFGTLAAIEAVSSAGR